MLAANILFLDPIEQLAQTLGGLKARHTPDCPDKKIWLYLMIQLLYHCNRGMRVVSGLRAAITQQTER